MRVFHFIERDTMHTSARNQFSGTITAIQTGAVNDEVELTLAGCQKIVAVVTRSSSAP